MKYGEIKYIELLRLKSLLPFIVTVILITLLLSGCGSDTVDGADEPERFTPETDVWTGAYFAGWNHSMPESTGTGHMPTEAIDWIAFSHMIYFHVIPDVNGSLLAVDEIDYMRGEAISSVVSAAHQNKTPILFSVGGWGSYDGFHNSIKPENQYRFISNLLSFMETWGFDGIDINMEPIEADDIDNYITFIDQLFIELQNYKTQLGYLPLLTAATHWQADMFAGLTDYFDQINLMTYDYSGAWDGWVSWHNSPIYSNGFTFPGETRELPSIHNDVNEFINAGVPPEKLGIGIVFTAYVWKGFVNAPLQDWVTPPEVTENVPYYQIMQEYYSAEFERWDDDAKAAYLSIIDTDSLNNLFVSYDSERSIEEKFNYIREKRLGGSIIWEIGSGYNTDLPPVERNPLLRTVRRKLWNY